MDMHSIRERMWGGGYAAPSPMFIPAPMAFFGVIVSFMLGMLFGMMWGKKVMLMKMMAGKGHMKGMHHHHGWGMGACCEKHGGDGHMQEVAMPEGGGGRAEGAVAAQ